jgi:predicted XRE-type DNA-binding protein
MIEEKILKVFSKSGLSRIEFANKLKISNAVLSHLASGRNKASLDLVINVLTYFPGISADWLILDKGDMERPAIENTVKLKDDLSKHIARLQQGNHQMQKDISSLANEVESLK